MRYPRRPEHLALDGLHLVLRSGKINAITGPSGGGKSTTFALLQRFYDQTSGLITFGGVDSQMIPLEVLRSHLAIVSQNSVLFEGDIRMNLCVRRYLHSRDTVMEGLTDVTRSLAQEILQLCRKLSWNMFARKPGK